MQVISSFAALLGTDEGMTTCCEPLNTYIVSTTYAHGTLVLVLSVGMAT